MNKEKSTLLWCYKTPNKLFTVNLEDNPLESIRNYVSNKLDIQTNYELVTIGGAYSKFMPIKSVLSHTLLDSIILVLPKKSINLTIWRKQEEICSLNIQLMQTVYHLKKKLSDLKGWPVNLIDFTFKGDILENSTQLANLQLDGKIQLILQPSPPFIIIVETFWGDTYQTEANRCSTANEIIQSIIIQTLSESVRFDYKNFLPPIESYVHLIMLKLNGTLLKGNECLNKYNLKPGDIVKIVTTGLERMEEIIDIHIVLSKGTVLEMVSARYDTWFIIALKLHFLLGISIDKITIALNHGHVKLHQPLLDSEDYDEKAIITANVYTNNKPKGQSNDCLKLSVKAPSGVVHQFSLNIRSKIKDVKRILRQEKLLEEIKYMNILHNNQILSSNFRIIELRQNEIIHLELQLKTISLNIKSKGNLDIQLTIPIKTSLAQLIEKIKPNTGNLGIIHAGKYLEENEENNLVHHGLYINSSIWLSTIENENILYLATSTAIVPLVIRSEGIDGLQIQQLQLSVGSRISLQLFANWRYKRESKTRVRRHVVSRLCRNSPQPSRTPMKDYSRILSSRQSARTTRFAGLSARPSLSRQSTGVKSIQENNWTMMTPLEYRNLRQQKLFKNQFYEQLAQEQRMKDWKNSPWSSIELRQLVRSPQISIVRDTFKSDKLIISE
ncbi:unnamed protein product [Dimorphilus gyrociliatus]|uniref:Ubiquitin-like domain-containing protein n=1 Tax=Dimorphilus gyrociliatus TaxID=2664684 RepID=A0A7I8W4W5_9ANNE|nr:unnamed protein product [Dimorphilus gyrociliatus]